MRWNAAVTRWNAGFYRHHALPLTGPAAEEFRRLKPSHLEARLLEVEKACNRKLPRPKWPLRLNAPTGTLEHSTRSPWAFSDAFGLHKRFIPRADKAA